MKKLWEITKKVYNDTIGTKTLLGSGLVVIDTVIGGPVLLLQEKLLSL